MSFWPEIEELTCESIAEACGRAPEILRRNMRRALQFSAAPPSPEWLKEKSRWYYNWHKLLWVRESNDYWNFREPFLWVSPELKSTFEMPSVMTYPSFTMPPRSKPRWADFGLTIAPIMDLPSTRFAPPPLVVILPSECRETREALLRRTDSGA